MQSSFALQPHQHLVLCIIVVVIVIIPILVDCSSVSLWFNLHSSNDQASLCGPLGFLSIHSSFSAIPFFFFSLLEYLMGNALLTQSLHFKDEEESHHQRGYVTCLTLLSSSTAGLRTHTQLCRWLSSLQCTEKKNKPQSN